MMTFFTVTGVVVWGIVAAALLWVLVAEGTLAIMGALTYSLAGIAGFRLAPFYDGRSWQYLRSIIWGWPKSGALYTRASHGFTCDRYGEQYRVTFKSSRPWTIKVTKVPQVYIRGARDGQ